MNDLVMADDIQPITGRRRVNIDPEGDVLLRLEDVELRVSSKILKLSSKVWKAMFSLSFPEGFALQDNVLLRIPLLDDDPRAMEALCKLLHHQPQDDSVGHTDEFLENLAIAADKYDCARVLHYWSRLCLGVRLVNKRPNSAQLLSAAYLFDDAFVFRQLTRYMVYVSPKTNSDGLVYGISNHSWTLLPDGLLETINLVEHELKTRLLERLEIVIGPSLNKPMAAGYPKLGILRERGSELVSHMRDHFSECDSTRISVYLQGMLRVGLWPLTSASRKFDLVDVIAKLKNANFQLPASVVAECLSCHLSLRGAINQANLDISKQFQGLCLDCVKYGKPKNGEEGRCRIAHPGYEGGLKTD